MMSSPAVWSVGRRAALVFWMGVCLVLGLLAAPGPALAQSPGAAGLNPLPGDGARGRATAPKTLQVGSLTLVDGDEVFLDIDGFQWTVGVLDNNEALVGIPGTADGANARLTIEVVDAAARRIRLLHRGRYIGRVSYWSAFASRRLSYYALGSTSPNGYGEFVVDASGSQKIMLREAGAWISRFCCVPGTSTTNAIVASFHGEQGSTGSAIGVRPAGKAAAVAALFADGARINLIADNGLRMVRCAGCQTSLNNATPNTVMLSDRAESEASTFRISTDAATGQVMLRADNGHYMAYCNGCIVGTVVPEFITLVDVAPSDPWIRFELRLMPNGRYTLRAPNGKYLARCRNCSPSHKTLTGVSDGDAVTAHLGDPDNVYAQWRIELTGATFRPGKTFDQYAWLTSHNAHVNYTDARWTAPNQSFGIIGQLDRGVRALMLDTFDFGGSHELTCAASFGSDCYPAGVYLCHGGKTIACSGGAGSNYALPRQSLKDALDAIGDWLDRNTRLTDVVTIFLEDYTSPQKVAETIKASKAAKHLFNPTHDSWTVTRVGWPTLEYLSRINRRLLVFTDNAANTDGVIGLVLDQDYTVANTWSIGVLGLDLECRTRWGSVPLDQKETSYKRLFMLSHFRDVPSTGTAYDDNEGSLPTKVNNCIRAAGRYPNFVAIDFFEIGKGAKVVEELNSLMRR